MIAASAMQCLPSRARRFTLVEMIAGLVVLAVIGAIFFPFLMGILQKTNDVPQPVVEANELVAVMEMIGNDYDTNAALRQDLSLLRSRILADPSPYGTGFQVVQCSYVRFDDGAEQPGDASDCLKVVLANDGSTLAAVFPAEGSE
jgi:type II secretory pathway component PulJ